ncbi:MAG: ABC transporter permease [Zoogloeaceae bacterium]|jgi:peptide/nickel transport system permease protein|nr:ABC transporter permease [Zoogloeaceae bacterium]
MTQTRISAVFRFLRRRLWQVVPVVFGIALLNFLILQLAPGDVVDVLAGEAGAATPEYMARLRADFGLDKPVPVQFLHYIQHTALLDLGFSFRQNMPVLQLILERLPATLALMTAAMGIAVISGLILGVLSARHVHRAADRVISIFVLVTYALPTFWLGLMAIVLFSARLGWLPSSGMTDISVELTGFAYLRDLAKHTVLPALTLATFYLAVYTRLVRTAMLEYFGADFIRTARAKGATEARITLFHALRNALLPLMTMLGLQLGSILSGAVLVESVFSWPGLGRLAFESVLARDFNLLLGILLFSSVMVTVLNICVDVVYAFLDPRIEF